MRSIPAVLIALILAVVVVAPVVSAVGSSPPMVESTPAAVGSSPSIQADDPRPPDEQWNRTYDSPGNEIISSITETSEGYFLTGWTERGGSHDAWLLAVDEQGRERWSVIVGDDGTDRAYDAVRTADGGYLVAGRTDENGQSRAWLMKVEDGSVEWERTVASRPGGFRAIERNKSAILVGGWTWQDGTAGWLVTVDERGEVLRERTYHSGEDAKTRVKSLSVDGDGVFLAGESETDDDHDGWAARIAANGTAEWSRTYGNSSYDDIWAGATTDDGYVLAGETGDTEQEGRDAWALALDSKGDVRWNRTDGGDGYDWFDSAAATDEGLLFTGGTEAGKIGGVDGFVVMTDDGGTERWQTIIGTTQWDKPWPATATDGGYLLAGQTSGHGTNGTAGWLVRLEHVSDSSVASTTETTDDEQAMAQSTNGQTDRQASARDTAESLWRPEIAALVVLAALVLGVLVAIR